MIKVKLHVVEASRPGVSEEFTVRRSATKLWIGICCAGIEVGMGIVVDDLRGEVIVVKVKIRRGHNMAQIPLRQGTDQQRGQRKRKQNPALDKLSKTSHINLSREFSYRIQMHLSG